jgi:hypothetical protein
MWMAVTAFDMSTLRFDRIPSYLIFDEQTRKKGAITRVGHGSNRAYRWSLDNSDEIRRGWILSADDPAELATRLGIEVNENLVDTINIYNEACKKQLDEKFGRSKKTLTKLSGKYYGLPLWPCLLNTQGGPRRNARGEILDVWGTPIRRLYGVGELGSIWGFLYQSGGNLAECLGLGRMVGFNVSAESPLMQVR